MVEVKLGIIYVDNKPVGTIREIIDNSRKYEI